MTQRVITQSSLLRLGNPYAQSIEHDEKTAIGKALAEGWGITHVATAIAGDYLLSTFVLDKAPAHKSEVHF